MNVRELRLKVGLSQAKLGEATGIPKGRISQWEFGKANPKAEDTQKLVKFFSQALNLDPVEILGLKSPAEVNKAIRVIDQTSFTPLGGGLMRVETPFVPSRGFDMYIQKLTSGDPPDLTTYNRFTLTMKEPTLGDYLSFEVLGDAMDDGTKNAIPEGSVVTGRRLEPKLWNDRMFMHTFQNYVFVTASGVLIREVIEHRIEEGSVVCRALNPTTPDSIIKLSDVLELFYVKAVTRLF